MICDKCGKSGRISDEDAVEGVKLAYRLGVDDSRRRAEKSIDALSRSNYRLLMQLKNFRKSMKNKKRLRFAHLIAANTNLFSEVKRLDALFPDLEEPIVRIKVEKLNKIINSLKKHNVSWLARGFERMINEQLNNFPGLADKIYYENKKTVETAKKAL